jgi:predicted small lipoprotein YifL
MPKRGPAIRRGVAAAIAALALVAGCGQKGSLYLPAAAPAASAPASR